MELTYLSGADVDALALTDPEILDSIRAVLAAQGRGETVIEPRTHLFPRRGAEASHGHFNVLRGAVPEFAGVKVVGDYVGNHLLGLPSELALLLLLDPDTGVPRAIVDATAITEMRTGAVTAIGAEYLARRDSRLWVTWARGPPRTGTCASCARCFPNSRTSGCTPCGRRAERRSRGGSPTSSGATYARWRVGRSASGMPTSWSRPAV